MDTNIIKLTNEVRSFLRIIGFPEIPEGANYIVVDKDNSVMYFYEQLSYEFIETSPIEMTISCRAHSDVTDSVSSQTFRIL